MTIGTPGLQRSRKLHGLRGNQGRQDAKDSTDSKDYKDSIDSKHCKESKEGNESIARWVCLVTERNADAAPGRPSHGMVVLFTHGTVC